MIESTLTERGQVSIPAKIRKSMGLKAGQRLQWEQVSDLECRISVIESRGDGPLSVLGYAEKIRGSSGRSTSDWMKELRAGEMP